MINKAVFVKSSSKESECPEADKPEYAFIGRSNVGKSSLINALTNNKNLAKTSGKPGKTKLINHFLIDESWYLVDLPGYGYAKVSKTDREKWTKNTKKYLLNRANLVCVMVLIDARIPPQKIDLDFIEWLGQNRVPFVIVYTKVDKLKNEDVNKNVDAFKAEMEKKWSFLPGFYQTSALSKEGLEELYKFILSVNADF